MLKKLRLKFIVFSMVIVLSMLGAIFFLLYHSTSRNLETQSIEMMRQISSNHRKAPPEETKKGDIRLPYFSVRLSSDGSIEEVSGGFFDLSDTEKIAELVSEVQSNGENTGVLKEHQLRYCMFESPKGVTVVFADTTSEQATLSNLIKTFIMLGGLAFIVFLAISIILARWAVKPVGTAWQQQKQFVADASHELKTPLTVIMTNAELMKTPGTDAEKSQYTDNILAMSRQMRGLVDELLELARLDCGAEKEKHGEINLSDAVSNAAMMFEPVFFEKELPFGYEIEPDVTVCGNATQLGQLVEILLDNASKYASPGGVTSLKLSKTQKKTCRIEVSNQGEKISDEDMKNLFKRFYRADKTRAMNHSYGLGLAIAQSIAEEHHGRIWAKSAERINTFTVELPMQK